MIDVKKELTDNIDQKYKEFHTKIVPDAKDILGVRMPVIRSIAKRICKDDWRSFLQEPVDHYEEMMLNALVIANAKMNFEERLKFTKEFVPKIDNWAVCDIFCGDWYLKDQEDKKKLWKYCLDLIDSNDEYKMRVSAVMMLNHFLDDEHINDVLFLITTKYHEGYYYRMGAAWTLSYCFIKYPNDTEPLLFDCSLDPDIRNKTLQKIFDSFRVSKENKERLKNKKRSL